MSFIEPSATDRELLKDEQERNPEVVQLAQLCSLARTIEPLLIRNLRLRYLPDSDTALESQLWFGSLVSARSTRNIVLHHGVAGLLAKDLAKQDTWLQRTGVSEEPTTDGSTDWQKIIWKQTLKLTEHWPALDKLEQKLRYYALTGEQSQLKNGLRHVLYQISATSDKEKQRRLARWAKQTLPNIALKQRTTDSDIAVKEQTTPEEIGWLAQFAAQTLGSSAEWTRLSSSRPLPEPLKSAVPEPFFPADDETRQIGVRLYYDPAQQAQILEFTTTEPTEHDPALLPLPSSLPITLLVSYGNHSQRHTISEGSRIKLDGSHQRIVLTTIEGKNYTLLAQNGEPNPKPKQAPVADIYLGYVKQDQKLAEQLAQFLKENKLPVKLLEEQPKHASHLPDDPHALVLRLWSRQAHQQWKTEPLDPEEAAVLQNQLILQTDQSPAPQGVHPAQRIQLPDLSRLLEMAEKTEVTTGANSAQQILAAIDDWMKGRSIDQSTLPSDSTETTDEPDLSIEEDIAHTDEVKRLLKELDDPETPPKRRLEIGDQLAGMGDPRVGIGTKTIEIIEYSPEVQSLLDELKDIKTEPPSRLKIGNQLAEMGDPRFGVGLDQNGLPEIDWVEIPAGKFIYGDKESQSTLELQAFFISRYTITNAQYQAFVDDGGYEEERWWKDLKKPQPEKSNWQQSNRPKEKINWYEAVAYTRWLSSRLGYKISLPTEQQWEKAARGTDGRRYPWGDEYLSGYANVDEKEKENKDGKWYLEETIAVGMYPQAKSPNGVQDLSGNAWEWCLNKYGDSSFTNVDTSGESRVLRGGSWFSSPEDALASWRLRGLPAPRHYDRGFRVVCVLPFTGR